MLWGLEVDFLLSLNYPQFTGRPGKFGKGTGYLTRLSPLHLLGLGLFLSAPSSVNAFSSQDFHIISSAPDIVFSSSTLDEKVEVGRWDHCILPRNYQNNTSITGLQDGLP